MYVLNKEISNKFTFNIKYYCLCTQLHTTPLLGGMGMCIFDFTEMQDHKYSAVPYCL